MEFRLLVPILPFCFIIIVWLIFCYIQKNTVRIVLVLLVFLGSPHHAFTYSKNSFLRDSGISTIAELSTMVKGNGFDWKNVGGILAESFSGENSITIATTAAGAIPYYSNLKTVDMIGLNDKWIARNGIIYSSYPGHQRLAPLEYLLEKEVNLVLAHPQVVKNTRTNSSSYTTAFVTLYLMKTTKNNPLLKNFEILEIPINQNYKLITLYLVKNPIINKAIEENHWGVFPILGI